MAHKELDAPRSSSSAAAPIDISDAHPPPPDLSPLFSDDDLTPLICASFVADYNCAAPQPERAALRLVSKCARRLMDGLCRAYVDRRLHVGAEGGDISAAHIGTQAAAAMHLLGPLAELVLEGLDDDGLTAVLGAACSGSGAELVTLALPRSKFEGLACASSLAPLPKLLDLDLSGCGSLTDEALGDLVAACPALSRLRLTLNARLREPQLTCPTLRSATLAICSNLRDAAVARLCAGALELRELSLWRCSSLVAPEIRGPRLQSVNLCECVALDDRALVSLTDAVACPALSCLLLAGCDALSAAAPTLGGALLTTLDLSDLACLSDAPLSAACAATPHLQRLDVSRSTQLVLPELGGPALSALICSHCAGLADEAASAACERSPRLATLMLSLCTSLYAPRLHGEHLAEVNLSGCSQLTDGAVSFLCRSSPRLSRLGLSLCAALAAPKVCGACLTRLDMAHCEALANPTLGGPRLTELNLCGCARLPDGPLEAACAACPALQRLCVDGCAALREPRLASATLQALSCQGISPQVLGAASDRTRCPALLKVRS